MKCENCENEHTGDYGTGRFCSAKCARGFSTKNKRDAINICVSKKLKGKVKKENIKCCSFCEQDFYSRRDQKYCSILCWKNEIKLSKTAFENYKLKCKFLFNVYHYPKYFDLALIEKFGWYSAVNKGDNRNGISRDHIYSIKEGFLNNISSEIISHPANCRLINNVENQKKRTKSFITIEDLKDKILLWKTIIT